MREIPNSTHRLDSLLKPFLDRPLPQVDPIERAILRIGVYELVFRADIPWKVVVSEAVESAKVFGAEQSHRYVNGILDKVARNLPGRVPVGHAEMRGNGSNPMGL